VYEIAKFLHFIGMALGIGGGLSNLLLGYRASRATMPEAAVVLRAMAPVYARVATAGLALLWLSGLYLLAWSGLNALTIPAFQAKLAFVVLLTGLSVLARSTARNAVKAGLQPKPGRIRAMGVATLTSAFIALAFAILAFN
jgi:hypothetical protein